MHELLSKMDEITSISFDFTRERAALGVGGGRGGVVGGSEVAGL